MNKKLFLGFAATAMVMASSCSNDDLAAPNSGDMATVTFNINSGEVTSRSISDGTQATTLVYAVFDQTGKRLAEVSKTEEGLTDLTTGHPISLRLAKGQTYTVAFWAQHPDAPYTIDYGTDENQMLVSMHYAAVDGETSVVAYNNDEKRDAFFKKETITISGDANYDVVLNRPFAQVNVGTSDYAEAVKAGITVAKSKVTFTNVANTLNILDGSVSDFTGLVYEASNIVTSEPLKVEGKEYKWLSMSYVLPAREDEPESVTLTSAEFTFLSNGNDIILKQGLENMPIQRNYRTNIIGQFLTGEVHFNVRIDSEFQNPDYNIVMWDGKTTTEPAIVGDTYMVKSAAEWAWLTQYDNRALPAKNISLLADIDFNGHAVKPIFGFQGWFDGQLHTMSNIVFDATGSYSVGLFKGDQCTLSEVSNVTIENVTIDNYDKVGVESNNIHGYAGVVMGDAQSDVKFTNVHVKKASVKGIIAVGGIVGFLKAGETATFSACSVEESYITNYAYANESGYVAGLVGRPVGDVVFADSDTKVLNTTIRGYWTERRGEASVAEVLGGKANPSQVQTSGIAIEKILLWDGTTVREPQLLGNMYMITNASEWAWMTAVASPSHDLLTGKQIVLTADIDFGGNVLYGAEGLLGGATFNGYGHTMSNAVLATTNPYTMGLFKGDACALASVENVTIENFVVDNAPAGSNGFAAVVIGDVNGAALTMSDVHVKNCTVKGIQSVAGLVGFEAEGFALTLTNCSVEGCEISNYAISNESGFVAGLVGRPLGTIADSGCVVKDTKINGFYAARRGANSIAEVFGNLESTSVTVSGNKVNRTAI